MSLTSRLFVVVLASLGAAPVDDVMTLVPADSALVLVVEDLRDHWREVGDSPLAARLRQIPAVRDWERSDKGDDLRKARADLESGLGIGLGTLRDDVLGDCVVLAWQPPSAGANGEPSGLLLTKFRDRAVVEKVLKTLNDAEKASGTLLEVVKVGGGATAIYRRKFAPGTKPDEWHALLPGDIFAWSNSEPVLRGVIARTATRDGLGRTARYRTLRRSLPAKAMATLYVDPPSVAKMAAEGKEPLDPMVAALLGGMESFGAAIEWRGGPVLHLRERFEPLRLPGALRPKKGSGGLDPSALKIVPRSALAVASWRWDLAAWYDLAMQQVPPGDQPRAEALATAAKGMLLGLDPRADLLPALSPGGVAFVDINESSPRPVVFDVAAILDVADRKDVGEAIENGLRTLAALAAADSKRPAGLSGVKVEARGASRITTLAIGDRSASFAGNARRVVLGTDPEAVARMLEGGGPRAGDGAETWARLRDEFFPKCDGFVALDFAGLHGVAKSHRDHLAKRVAKARSGTEVDAGRDIDKALELMEPFGRVFAAWEVSEDGTSSHQVFGLLGRSPKP